MTSLSLSTTLKMVRRVAIATALIGVAGPAFAQSHSPYGNKSYGWGGSNTTRYSGTTFGSDGTSRTTSGSRTYGSDYGHGRTPFGAEVRARGSFYDSLWCPSSGTRRPCR